jgi:hypothetical protein
MTRLKVNISILPANSQMVKIRVSACPILKVDDIKYWAKFCLSIALVQFIYVYANKVTHL